MALKLLRNAQDTAPESVADVDTRIRANEAEAVKLAQERAAIEDDLILADESDPSLLDKISRIDVQIKVTAGRRQRLQAERMQALGREALVTYDQLCTTEADVVARKREIDALIAPLRAQLQKLAEQSAAHLAQLETLSNRRIHFVQELPEAARGALSPLARKEIEYRHGLANAEEIEGARRQASQRTQGEYKE